MKRPKRTSQTELAGPGDRMPNPTSKMRPKVINSPEFPDYNLQGAPTDVVKREFAKRLLAAMVERGWNQSETARQAALHMPDGVFGRDSISHYTRAVAIPGPIALNALAKAFRMKPADLLPSRGMPALEAKTPSLDVKDAGDGSVWLRVNQRVEWAKALKVMELLKGE